MAQQLIDPEKLKGFVLVRVRGKSKRHGLRLERYGYKGHIFEESQGWYAKPESMAGEFRNCLVEPGNPDSAYALEVVTPEEALRIQHREANPVEPGGGLGVRGGGGPLPFAHEARQAPRMREALEERAGGRDSEAGFDGAFVDSPVSAGGVDDRSGSVDTAKLALPVVEEGRDMAVGLLAEAPEVVQPKPAETSSPRADAKPRGRRGGS